MFNEVVDLFVVANRKKVATEPRSLGKTKSSSAVHAYDNQLLGPPDVGMQHAVTAELLNQDDIYNSAV